MKLEAAAGRKHDSILPGQLSLELVAVAASSLVARHTHEEDIVREMLLQTRWEESRRREREKRSKWKEGGRDWRERGRRENGGLNYGTSKAGERMGG